jgi:hypothetical protein
VIDFYNEANGEWVMGNALVFKGSSIQIEVEDCNFEGDVPTDFDKVRLVECVDGTKTLFDKVVQRSAVNVDWTVKYCDEDTGESMTGVGVKYMAATNSLMVLIDEQCRRSTNDEDKYELCLVDDDMILAHCNDPHTETLFQKLRMHIEATLQQLAHDNDDDEDDDDEQKAPKNVLEVADLEAKYKAGEDIEVDWVVDYYDNNLHDWHIGNGLVFKGTSMYVEVEDIFEGEVPLDFSRLRLVEPDEHTTSLFNWVVANSSISVNWDVSVESNDTGQVIQGQGIMYQAATNSLQVTISPQGDGSGPVSVSQPVDEEMSLIKCHDAPGTQSMEMFNKLTAAVEDMLVGDM